MATLVRWEPFRELTQVQGEVNRLMNGILGGGGAAARRGWTPALDVWETDTELVYAFDLPGVAGDAIALEAQDDTLTVTGSRERVSEETGDRFYRFERRFGAFSRSVGLPAGADASKIAASYVDGVLEVRVPKPEDAKPRRIQIGSAPADVEGTATPSAA